MKNKLVTFKFTYFFIILAFYSIDSSAQKTEIRDKTINEQKTDTSAKWFEEAKFGLFIHWGLYALPAGEWKGKNYYGISEWLMYRGKIPVSEYSKLANHFNPSKFNADQWADIATRAGFKYLVITAKHHEGFAMFDTKVSDFKITNTPFKRDPMKELSAACDKAGIKMGFYYSQFQDWHEPNGGGNDWDFVDSLKDYKKYYQSKSIPQIKELVSNYGPLGLIWFDLPGGLSKKETQSLIDEVRHIQPNCLLSSRIGQGFGDFRDYGDGEIPAGVVKGPWEAIFTSNDSWGYSKFDFDFKSPKDIVRLLATIVSKGGNLMLNVGPKADGAFPEESVNCLMKVGEWLKANGESIYGTTYGPISPQPWGVTTLKPGKLFLHVMQAPANCKIIVPGMDAAVTKVYFLENRQTLQYSLKDGKLVVTIPSIDLPDTYNSVIVVEFNGRLADSYQSSPEMISQQYESFSMDINRSTPFGGTKIEPVTYSNYFGDWQHATCAIDMRSPADSVKYDVDFTEPGDYKLLLEYACAPENSNQEGVLNVGGKKFLFQTLTTSSYDQFRPLMFIKQAVAQVHIAEAGKMAVSLRPKNTGKELFKIKRIIIVPVK